MVVLDGNFVPGCGPETDWPVNTYISMHATYNEQMLVTNEVLEPITFVLAYPTVSDISKITMLQG
jgi:hypothetical protein